MEDGKYAEKVVRIKFLVVVSHLKDIGHSLPSTSSHCSPHRGLQRQCGKCRSSLGQPEEYNLDQQDQKVVVQASYNLNQEVVYQDGTYQEVVEANLLLFQEDKYGEGVAADAENPEYKHQETCAPNMDYHQ